MHIWGRTTEDISRLHYRRMVEDGVRATALWGTPRRNRAARRRYPGVVRHLNDWRRPHV